MREDWVECRLNDLISFKIGGDWGKSPEIVDQDFIDVYCIRGSEFRNWKEEKGKSACHRKIKKNSFVTRGLQINDILVEISGGGPEQPVGRTEIIDTQVLNNFKGKKLVFTNFLRLLRPHTSVNSVYLNLYLKYFYSTGKIIEYQAGSNNLRNLKFDKFINITIPYPPAPIQRAIVKKIEQLFSALDAGVADLKKAQEQLKIYRQAVLKKAFEGEFTKEWRRKNKIASASEFLKRISQLRQKNKFGKESIYYKKISHDFTFTIDPNIPTWALGSLDKLVYIAARIGWRGLKKDEYKKDGPLFLSVHSLNHGKYVDYREAFHLAEDRYEESPEIQLNEGDILLCKDGAGIGKLGIIKDLPDRATVNSSLLVVRGMEVLNQDFLYYLFLSPALQQVVLERITGSATPHLFQNDIRQFQLSIPPPDEQLQIVKEIESRLSLCDVLEHQIASNLNNLSGLRQSILKRAFNGALLSRVEIEACYKDADYEPTALLLEKLKVAKQGSKIKVQSSTINSEVKPAVGDITKISADIHAGLLTKVIKLHEAHPDLRRHLGHVKCEKIAHLIEYYAKVPLGRSPVKDAAGPDDYSHLKKIEHRAKMAGYFSVVKQEVGYSYKSGRNAHTALNKFESNLSAEQHSKVEKILKLFLPFDLEATEAIATTYAGWNNLIILGNTRPSDDEIIAESRENWSKRKLGIPRERFYEAIQWMQKKEISIIPTGYGQLVSKPTKKKK